MRTAGFAVELTLRNFSFARTPFSGWLLRAPPAVTAALSVATWWAEIAALPLLLCPVVPVLARCVAVVTFLGFHSGLVGSRGGRAATDAHCDGDTAGAMHDAARRSRHPAQLKE